MGGVKWTNPSAEGAALKNIVQKLNIAFNAAMASMGIKDNMRPEEYKQVIIDVELLEALSSMARAAAYVADIKDKLATLKDLEKRVKLLELDAARTADEELEAPIAKSH